MEDWTLKIEFHWPQDRFALGGEYIDAERTYQYSTIKI